jgi:hypothetical protein
MLWGYRSRSLLHDLARPKLSLRRLLFGRQSYRRSLLGCVQCPVLKEC